MKNLLKEYTKEKLPEINPGDTISIHQKINEKGKTRIQIFEGVVIKRHGGKGLSGTFTVRKISADGIGVEKIFFLHSPIISKITILKKGKTRRSQLYYIRRKQLKSLKLKEKKEFQGIKEWEEENKEEKPSKIVDDQEKGAGSVIREENKEDKNNEEKIGKKEKIQKEDKPSSISSEDKKSIKELIKENKK